MQAVRQESVENFWRDYEWMFRLPERWFLGGVRGIQNDDNGEAMLGQVRHARGKKERRALLSANQVKDCRR